MGLFNQVFSLLISRQPSPHGTRQWLECPQYTGINHMPVYGGTNQVYAVTAGATMPAAFAGVHRNHHFDTIQRLHPLMHPLNTGNAPPPSGHWFRLLFILRKIARVAFSFTKKEISTRHGQYLFLLIIIHLSSFRSIPLPRQNVLLNIFRTD